METCCRIRVGTQVRCQPEQRYREPLPELTPDQRNGPPPKGRLHCEQIYRVRVFFGRHPGFALSTLLAPNTFARPSDTRGWIAAKPSLPAFAWLRGCIIASRGSSLARHRGDGPTPTSWSVAFRRTGIFSSLRSRRRRCRVRHRSRLAGVGCQLGLRGTRLVVQSLYGLGLAGRGPL